MKTMTNVISGLTLAGMLAISVAAQTSTPAPAPKPAAMSKAAPAAKSDAEILTDIQKRLAAAPKLKSENISASVTNGVAIFTGVVKNSGSKGGVVSLAKAAGAKSVVNNLTIEKPAKPAPATKQQ
jgi:osmotically-inducible protein OsmY